MANSADPPVPATNKVSPSPWASTAAISFDRSRPGQPAVCGPSGVELVPVRGEQCLGDSVLLQIGRYRDWPEESDAAPFRREVGAHQDTVDHRADRRDMRRPPA